jgi:hypothetical protein
MPRKYKKMKKGTYRLRVVGTHKDVTQDRRIKKLENIVYPSIDWKTKDVKAVSANISNAGYENYPMFSLERGENQNQRSGDTVNLKYQTLHLSLTRGDTSNIIRVLLVRTPSSTYAGLSDVLEYHNFSTDGDLVFSSPLQVQQTNAEQKYHVMYDKVFQLKNDMSTIATKIKIKMPKAGRKCEFVGDSNTAPNNYNLSLLMISDSTAAPHPRASYVLRQKYIDL